VVVGAALEAAAIEGVAAGFTLLVAIDALALGDAADLVVGAVVVGEAGGAAAEGGEVAGVAGVEGADLRLADAVEAVAEDE
ncbi:hypothetical protein, partial [Mycobacterium tuberculosis]